MIVGHKADSNTVRKRIHIISLLLRRKSTNYIINFAKQQWGVERVQVYNYIKDAKVEWAKYFEHLKRCGKDYHMTQLRDIKDQAYSKKTIVGAGKDKKTIRTPDLGLVFDIAKEEAKLMGVYPVEKHELNFSTSFAQWVKEVKDKKEIMGKMKVIKHKPAMVKEEPKKQIETVGRVPKDTNEIVIEAQIEEEPQTHREIVRAVPSDATVRGEEKEPEESFVM